MWKRIILPSVIATVLSAAVLGVFGVFSIEKIVTTWLLNNVELKTDAKIIDNVGGIQQKYKCESPMKVLSCRTYLIPTGNAVCGTEISSDGTACAFAGCNQVNGQNYRTEIICGGLFKPGA